MRSFGSAQNYPIPLAYCSPKGDSKREQSLGSKVPMQFPSSKFCQTVLEIFLPKPS